MYESYFGLTCEPFSVAADPRFIYLSPKHRQARAHLNHGLRRGAGFLLLTGAIGAGKTTVCRLFLRKLPTTVDVAFVVNPRLDSAALLTRICEDLRIDVPSETVDLIDLIHGHLLLADAAGRRTLIVVDEAQALSFDVLEQLRLLTNLDATGSKLQVFLIGQPELRVMLQDPALEALAQRVVGRFHLSALAEDETATYVAHRLSVAGLNGPIPFDDAALRTIHRLTGGVPRRINVLCDQALVAAHAADTHHVSTDMIELVAANVFDDQPTAAQPVNAALPLEPPDDGAGPRSDASPPPEPLPRGAASPSDDVPPAVPPLGAAAPGAVSPAAASPGLPPDDAPTKHVPLSAVYPAAFGMDAPAAIDPTQYVAPEPRTTRHWQGYAAIGVGALLLGVYLGRDRLSTVAPVAALPRPSEVAAAPAAPAALPGPAAAESTAASAAPPIASPPDTAVGTDTRLALATEMPAHPTAGVPALAVTAPTSKGSVEGIQVVIAAAATDEQRVWRDLANLWDSKLGPGEACLAAARLELRCFRSAGGLATIRQLGRPGILKLTADGHPPVYALLVALSDTTATFRSGNTEHKVALPELGGRWYGYFATLWRPPPGYRTGESSRTDPAVALWMDKRLAIIDGAALPTGDAAALTSRVFAFQLAHGLAPDGMAGPLTLMQLNRDSGIEEPRLRIDP